MAASSTRVGRVAINSTRCHKGSELQATALSPTTTISSYPPPFLTHTGYSTWLWHRKWEFASDSPNTHLTSSTTNDSEAGDTADMSLETAIEQAKRAFALQKYEQAVELYTTALEKLYDFLPLALRRASSRFRVVFMHLCH
jgi:hypothetical protein